MKMNPLQKLHDALLHLCPTGNQASSPPRKKAGNSSESLIKPKQKDRFPARIQTSEMPWIADIRIKDQGILKLGPKKLILNLPLQRAVEKALAKLPDGKFTPRAKEVEAKIRQGKAPPARCATPTARTFSVSTLVDLSPPQPPPNPLPTRASHCQDAGNRIFLGSVHATWLWLSRVFRTISAMSSKL
jgi:hypothetical protein